MCKQSQHMCHSCMCVCVYVYVHSDTIHDKASLPLGSILKVINTKVSF